MAQVWTFQKSNFLNLTKNKLKFLDENTIEVMVSHNDTDTTFICDSIHFDKLQKYHMSLKSLSRNKENFHVYCLGEGDTHSSSFAKLLVSHSNVRFKNGNQLDLRLSNITNEKNNNTNIGELIKKNTEMIIQHTKFINTIIPKNTTRFGVVKDENRTEHYFQIIKQITEKNGGTILSKENEYEDAHSKLKFECKIGHKFEMSYVSIKKAWCPHCSCYKMEALSKFLIQYIFGEKFEKTRPIWLLNDDGHRLELDIYNERLNVAFEYNGRQHYFNLPHFFKTEEAFEKRKLDDMKKLKLCKEKNITLIVIPYTVKEEELYDYILNELQKKKINFAEPKGKPDLSLFKAQNDYQERVEKCIAEKGGKLIDGIYVTCKSKFKVMCSQGHEWNVCANNLFNGTWCGCCIKKECAQKAHVARLEMCRLKREQILADGKKACTLCKEIKSLDKFGQSSETNIGVTHCKSCDSELAKDYRLKKKLEKEDSE